MTFLTNGPTNCNAATLDARNVTKQCRTNVRFAKSRQMTGTVLDDVDEGIKEIVLALRKYGVETIESCQGGEGHTFPEPTVRFAGGKAEGYRALSTALQSGLNVAELRRVWPILDMEPTGPHCSKLRGSSRD